MLKRLMLVGLVAALVLPLAQAQEDETFSDKIRLLLREATDLYKRGKYPEAYAKYEEAFQMKPSSELIYAYMKRVGEDLVAGMMNSPDVNMQNVGRRLYELAKPGEPYRPGSKEIIAKYLHNLQADDHVLYMDAHWHLKNFGAYAVRFVLPVLKNKLQDRHRSRVILLLTQMGLECSPALIEALDTKDAFMRQQAAIILGNVKDDRAIPALKRIVEDANEAPEVKKYADEALRKIIRYKKPEEWKTAQEYYYELAMKYYYSHSTAILAWQRHHLLWKWDAEKDVLTERRVARMVYNEQLAEEALFDLLELNPGYVDEATGYSPWSLFVCVNFAQAVEARCAIEAALDALKVDDIDRPGLVRLIQEIEGKNDANIKALADAINGAGGYADIVTIVSKYLEKQAKVIRANVLAELPGKGYVFEALARCLDDGNYLVAKACIEAAEQMALPDDLPNQKPPKPEGEEVAVEEEGKAAKEVDPGGSMGFPLIEALYNEDKRVRYAAAKAMATINPQEPKLGMELVIPNLIDALGEQGVRVALVIYDVQDEVDRSYVNGLRKLLLGLNVFPVIARSGEEGVIKAKQFPSEDLIIIQKKICGQVYFREESTRKPIVESMFDALRDDVRTKNVPRIILADTPIEEQEAKTQFLEKGTCSAVVAKNVDRLTLKAIMEKIFDLPEAKKDAKDRADEISRVAAETLSEIDPGKTLYPYRDAVPALIQTVSPKVLREDFIRIPAARALGRYGDTRAVDVLAIVLRDKDADPGKAETQKAVRWECAKALSGIFKLTGITPTEDVYKVLKVNLRDGDYDIELATGEALGNALLSNGQRLDLAKFRRLKRDTYTAEDP